REGYRTLQAASGEQALEVMQNQHVDVILSDQVMPGMGGLELLRRVRKTHGDLPFIVITAHAEVNKAVEAIREGAFDYVQKPVNSDELAVTIQRALEFRRLTGENVKLRGHLRDLYGFEGIVAESESMMKVLNLAAKVAQTRNTSVALFGESGTGKEVLARAIHCAGESMENRFVAINCAAVPEGLLESELFGHRRGAFTGADRDRAGRIEQAAGGTLLLDEIGDMTVDLQAKLLRVLETRTFEKVGAQRTQEADFRLIVATHRNLEERVQGGQFREDLYHRVNVFPIHIPPLRDRREDIPPLTEKFIKELRQSLGRPLRGISDEALTMLKEHSWPGNVRELKNCLERAAILTEDDQIRPEHLLLSRATPTFDAIPQDTQDKVVFSVALDPGEVSLDTVVDTVLEQTLQRFGDNKSKAAEFLKVNRKIFYRRGKLGS
ncbi:MAG: sigma-54-dependent Fis family transcriptional regulator, partial [bacterium]|nr:sigma-54-dependent Fis family transcriptional regulator [bacterium]